MGVVTAAVVGGTLAAGGAMAASKISSNAQKSGANKQAGLLQAGVDRIESVDVPTLESQLVQLQRLKLSGELTPDQEATVDQQITQLKSVSTDPALKDAQMGALNKLRQIGSEGGLTATDRAQLEDVLSTTRREGQSNRNAILQNARMRGVSGSGLEQAAELTAQQNDATNASNEGFKTAASAQQRALDAILSSGQLGGQIRDQDYGEAAAAAKAQDAINNFNTANKQAVITRNTAGNNAAKASNLNRADQESLYNTDVANREEATNKGLIQQNYQNEMDKAKSIAAGYAGQGQAASSAGNAAANNINSTGGAVAGALGQIGTTVANYYAGKKDPADPTKKV